MARTAFLVVLIALAASSAARAQAPRGGDAAPIIMAPEQLRWTSAAGMPGLSEAWLVGQAGKPGFYVVRRHFKLGGRILPRIDTHTIFLTVLSGDVYLGNDEQIDPRTARRCPTGTFVIIPAGSSHYVWARYGEAVIQEWGSLPGKPDASSPTTDPSMPRPLP